jgi:hypothetical protein
MRLLKRILYTLLLFLLVSYSFIVPKTNIFAEDVLPSLSIDSPASNSVLNTNLVVISGSFADVPNTGLLFTASDKSNVNYTNEKISDSDTNQTEWVIDGTNGTFTFTKELADGNHRLTIDITNKTNQTIVATKTKPLILLLKQDLILLVMELVLIFQILRGKKRILPMSL